MCSDFDFRKICCYFNFRLQRYDAGQAIRWQKQFSSWQLFLSVCCLFGDWGRVCIKKYCCFPRRNVSLVFQIYFVLIPDSGNHRKPKHPLLATCWMKKRLIFSNSRHSTTFGIQKTKEISWPVCLPAPVPLQIFYPLTLQCHAISMGVPLCCHTLGVYFNYKILWGKLRARTIPIDEEPNWWVWLSIYRVRCEN